MSIASEITRLQGAKADIKSAIEAKGVTVALDATLDDYDDYIAQISGRDTFNDWLLDGDTHLWINIIRSEQLDQQIRIRMIGTIDWGDGSAKDTANVTAYTTFSHTYSELGRYRIDLHPTSGTFYIGGGSSSYNIMGTRNTAAYSRSCVLYQTEIGRDIITNITKYAFAYCVGLERLYISKNITTIGDYVCYLCYSLHKVIFEDATKVTSPTLTGFFTNDYSLQEISQFDFSGGTTMNATVQGCNSLNEFTIPSTVQTLSANTLNNVYGLKALHCLPTTPPTVSNVNNFSNFPATCVIQVPIGSLSSYQSAGTWSDYSSQMVEAGTVKRTLTNVSSSNQDPMVDKNSAYTTTLTPSDGYTLSTVTVMMGGTDITSTAYSAGVVNIASVTGNIVITASAS